MEQPAYRLAVEVCNATANKLQRHVCQYFTDIIVQHSRDEEFDEIRAAHDLIKQLNRSCPSLLHNVVPQLEEELRVEEVQLRLMATQVLGEMFADTKAGADLVKKYPQTWTAWLMRKNDKSPAVRLAFVEETKELLVHVPELRAAIEGAVLSPIRCLYLNHFSQRHWRTKSWIPTRRSELRFVRCTRSWTTKRPCIMHRKSSYATSQVEDWTKR